MLFNIFCLGIFRIPIWESPREGADERKDQYVRELCAIDCFLPGVFRTTPTTRSGIEGPLLEIDPQAVLRFFTSLPQFVNRKNEAHRQLDVDIIMSPRGQDLHFDVRFKGLSLKTELRWPGNRRQRQDIRVDVEPVRHG